MDMWSVTLKVREDGGVQVEDVSTGVPAGELEIRGSDDGNRVTLEVRQRDLQGRFIASARHRRDRAGEAAVAVAGEITG